MAYSITKTNTSVIGSIADGSTNTSATSITLVGRNYANYGQIMVDSLVHMLENFADDTSPNNPLEGQLWWDATNSILKVRTGGATPVWKIVGGATAQSSAPTSTILGDLWWDTANAQLYVYDGGATGWVLVGPTWSKIYGKSGALWETILDTTPQPHDVVSMYLDGTRTAIISKDPEFTPNVAIPGFTTIKLGYNMSSSYNIYGTANNSSYLGNQPAVNYFRNNTDNTGTGSLGVLSDTGITIGTGSDLTLSITAGKDAIIRNDTAGGNIDLYANVGGISTRFIAINALTGDLEIAADPTTNLGVATKQYVDNKFVNATLTGVSTAITAPAGTANTMIATTEFVINNSGFFTNKIYQGNSYVEVLDAGSGNISVVVDSNVVATASSSGFNLMAGATAVTQAQTYNSSGNAAVATTQYVKTAATWWGGSAKFVETTTPDSGLGNDGDFWFQYTP